MIRGFAIDSNAASSSSSSSFTTRNVGYLMLSSTLGIIVGDVLWLEALRLLGPKRVIIIDSLRPFGAALLGRIVLDEELEGAAYGGMALAVLGVGIVAWEERTADDDVATTTTMNTATAAITTDHTSYDRRDDVTDGGGGKGADDDDNDFIVIDEPSRSEDAGRASPAIDDNRDCSVPSLLSRDGHDDDDASQRWDRFRRKIPILDDDGRGYACAIVNVFADSIGSLLTKRHGGGMTTWSINLIRFGYAGAILGMISAVMMIRGRRGTIPSREIWPSVGGGGGGGGGGIAAGDGGVSVGGGGPSEGRDAHVDIDESTSDIDETNRREEVFTCEPPPVVPTPSPRWYELPTLTKGGWLQINAGVLFVTFLCPTLSNYALFRLALGLAISLGSVGPLYGLVLDWPFRGRRPTVYGCAGAILAVSGVVILCLWGT